MFVPTATARRLLLGAQGLLDDPRRKATPDVLYELVERMGFVQVDSINIVERAHHLTLAARLQGYRPALPLRGLAALRDVEEQGREAAGLGAVGEDLEPAAEGGDLELQMTGLAGLDHPRVVRRPEILEPGNGFAGELPNDSRGCYSRQPLEGIVDLEVAEVGGPAVGAIAGAPFHRDPALAALRRARAILDLVIPALLDRLADSAERGLEVSVVEQLL